MGQLNGLMLPLPVPGHHKSASWYPSSSTSHPFPCLWPGRAQSLVVLPPYRKSRGGSWPLVWDQLSSGCCSHLWCEPVGGRASRVTQAMTIVKLTQWSKQSLMVNYSTTATAQHKVMTVNLVHSSKIRWWKLSALWKYFPWLLDYECVLVTSSAVPGSPNCKSIWPHVSVWISILFKI